MERLLHTAFKSLTVLAFIAGFTNLSYGQSPRKLLKNGFYEQAYLKATKKQNKKVKIKEKHAEVIYKSFEVIYERGANTISASDRDWKQSFDMLVRVNTFHSKMKHPGINEKLQDILRDQDVLGNLAFKFTKENTRDKAEADNYESMGEYFKAFDMYKRIIKRQEEAARISTLTDKITLIDTKKEMDELEVKIRADYIKKAKELLYDGSRTSATEAIALINKAKIYSPLDADEEELLTLANLILGKSWMEEAQKLMQTKTKRNARLAYDLINKTRSVRTLSMEEEKLYEEAEILGMTRVLVHVNGNQPIHSPEELCGKLNKKKTSRWITYYHIPHEANLMDLEMTVTENEPRVVVGDVRRRIEQRTETVEYEEEETDANGNVTTVKKTKKVTALVAIASKTKTASFNWSVTMKDLTDQKAVYTESHEAKMEEVNEFASLESGDILALPENIETEVDLDSQPFSSDSDMRAQTISQYLNELFDIMRAKKDHQLNMDKVLEQ